MYIGNKTTTKTVERLGNIEEIKARCGNADPVEWAKDYTKKLTLAEKVYPAIDENIFSVLYSDKVSRPNTPVNVIVGALILKEVLGDTDDELVESLMFDVRYQYALHTTSFEEQPLSDRTLSRFRARILAYETEHDVDLIHECITVAYYF